MIRFALAALLVLVPVTVVAQVSPTSPMGMTQSIIRQSAFDDPPARKRSNSWLVIAVTHEILPASDQNGCTERIRLTDGRATTKRLAAIYGVSERCVVGGE